MTIINAILRLLLLQSKLYKKHANKAVKYIIVPIKKTISLLKFEWYLLRVGIVGERASQHRYTEIVHFSWNWQNNLKQVNNGTYTYNLYITHLCIHSVTFHIGHSFVSQIVKSCWDAIHFSYQSSSKCAQCRMLLWIWSKIESDITIIYLE